VTLTDAVVRTRLGTRPNERLFPTPEAADGSGGRISSEYGGTRPSGSKRAIHLGTAVDRLLPTPTGRDHKDGSQVDAVETNALLGRAVWPREQWGDYAAAIARWEGLTRPAPSPTEPGARSGGPRLSPAFSEWMMGLPEGWVTGVPGITRNQALRLLGNGVVPQQAVAALLVMLSRAATGAAV